MKNRSQPLSRNSKTSIDPSVERAVLKAKCERDHLFFSRYFFKHRQGIKFRVNWHHVLIADTVQRVIDGELKNVVINVPPGSSKTELVAINLIARGLAVKTVAPARDTSDGRPRAICARQGASRGLRLRLPLVVAALRHREGDQRQDDNGRRGDGL